MLPLASSGNMSILLQGFVFLVSLLRELYDDIKRFFRDKGINGQRYYKLTPKGKERSEKMMYYALTVLSLHRQRGG